MKKIVILTACLLFLTACTALKNNAGNDALNPVTDSAVTGSSVTASAVSGSAASTAAVSSAAMGEQGEREKKKKEKVRLITDITGKKQKLKMDYIVEKDEKVRLTFMNYATEYSQIWDNHYYYMRKEGKRNYTLYRDFGEKEGSFEIEKTDAIDRCAKYGSKFYVLLRRDAYDRGSGSIYDVYKLVAIDFSDGSKEIICQFEGDDDRSIGNLIFYHDIIYRVDKSYHSVNGKEEKIIDMWNMQGQKLGISSFPRSAENEYLTIEDCVDGKVYYTVENDGGKKLSFFCRDLETGSDEKIFCYNHKGKITKLWNVFFERNQDDIFFSENYSNYWGDGIYRVIYMIPASGKQMKNILGNHAEVYSLHHKYIFYTDMKHRIHRWDRKTQEDKIISSVKAMGLDCTREGLFVREYNEWIADSERDVADDISNVLYYMDLDGKHVKKITGNK